MKSKQDLSKMAMKDLTSLEGELYKEIFDLKIKRGVGALKNTASLRLKKRELARVKTEIRRRQIEGVLV